MSYNDYWLYEFFHLQVRYPVLLTPIEKEMAREVCIAFRQAVSKYDTFGEQSPICNLIQFYSFPPLNYQMI